MSLSIAQVMGDRVVQRLLLGSACSAVADGVFLGALPLAVAARGGGPLQIGLISAALTAWYVVSVPLGGAVDRIGIGRAIRIAAPLRAAALMTMASYAFFPGADGLVVLGLGALAYGLLDTASSTATATLPALVVSADDHDATFSVLYTVRRVAELVLGPSLGALLLVTQHWLPFLVAAAGLSAAYVACRPFFADPRTQGADPEGEPAGWYRRAAAGLGHLSTEPFLRAVAITMVGIVIAEELVSITVAPYFRDGSAQHAWVQILGLIRGGSGAVSIIAALMAAGIARRYGRVRVLALVALGGAVCPAALAIGPDTAPVAIALLTSAIAEALWVPLVQSEIAGRTPAALMARTRAAMMFLTWGALPLASVFGGAVADLVGVRAVLLAAAALALLTCSLGIWPIAIRRRA